MKSLINVFNKSGNLVVSSREIANNFEKRHSDVIKAIEDLINKEGCAEKIVDLYQMFILTNYQNEQNGQNYKEYLLTRDGFSLLVMGFTGSKALQWKLKYIEAFNKMEQAIKNKPIPIEDMMIMQLEEQKKIKNRLETVEYKLDKQMTIDHGKQRSIQREISKKVYERVEYVCNDLKIPSKNYKGNQTPEFKEMKSKYFQNLYREIKNRFGVASYRDIKVKDFDYAVNYIRNWIEPQELRYIN